MSTREQSQHVVAQDFQHTLHRSLDETKENVNKSIDEARTQIPQFTHVVTNYQEQVLQSTGKMVEDYVEAQKSVMNAVFNLQTRIMKMLIECLVTGFLQEFCGDMGQIS